MTEPLLTPEQEAEAQRLAAIVVEKARARLRAMDWGKCGDGLDGLGTLVADLGKRTEAEEQYRQALAILEKLAAEFPAMPDYRGNSHWGRARAFDALAKPAEAAKDWDWANELSPPAERLDVRASRASSRLQAGRVAEAVAEVAELTQSSNWNAGEWYDFACVYAVASGKIADKKQEYADRAMELLRTAVQAGYKNAAHMKKDTDLDPLRKRAGLQEADRGVGEGGIRVQAMTESTRLHAALANLAHFRPEYQCIVAELAKTIVARSSRPYRSGLGISG